MIEKQSLMSGSLSDVTSKLRRTGFGILLAFSILIIIAVVFNRPENLFVAVLLSLVWFVVALVGLWLPNCGDEVAKVWALLSIPIAPYLVLSNGLLPATLIPIGTIFPVLLLKGWWRLLLMVILVSCSFLVPLHAGTYDSAIWLRVCITNITVSLLIFALSHLLESALTESKNKALELDDALEKEKQALASQSRFLATMSHEIRTPLNGILGLTDVVLANTITEQARPNLEKIQCSGQSLNRILNDILDLSKLNAGKLNLEFMPIDLKLIVKECMALYAPIANEKGVSLHIDIARDMSTLVIGDATRISQVLNNLISNAVKFTQQGSVRLSLTFQFTSSGDHVVHFSVMDTGEGISEQQQHIIFDAYAQADSRVNRVHGGTGLGLQIVKNLVEAMGGEIVVNSSPGNGSHFQFSLPLAITTIKEPKFTIVEPKRYFSGHVLVAEDNPINQAVAKSLLEMMGITVALANNGQEAIDSALAMTFDLILMDLHMPEVNGAEAAKLLRELNVTTPIIAFTAAVISDEINNALKSGMDGYLTKPVNKNALHTVLSKYLRTSQNRVDSSISRC
ncbi:MAG: DNA-binding protein [Alteromonas sp. Nap_26]|nr:MAG: DNA-binding protein [Alteromonas sp. Nap_26]